MSTLKISFDWEDPGGARGDELRATWSRLEIAVGEDIVTQVFDVKVNSVRPAVYVPLYPVAEWIVTNWWALLNECRTPTRTLASPYPRRHNLRFAAEGFAMPWLELCPTGDYVDVEWRARSVNGQSLQFLRAGRALLTLAAVRQSLTQFVDSVVARLDGQGVSGTPLQEEWSAIHDVSDDELLFCKAAGTMGLDPFNIHATTAADITAASALPSKLQRQFFESADPANFNEQLQWVNRCVEVATAQDNRLPTLLGIKRKLNENAHSNLNTWSRGYQLAQELRVELGISDVERIRFADLGGGDSFDSAIIQEPSTHRGFDALMGINVNGSPCFVVRSAQLASRRFAACRALYTFFDPDSAELALVSSAPSDSQKGNRAFAAELLAPSSLIKGNLSGNVVEQSEMQELAERFGVSEYVVAHQIQNHHLGELAGNEQFT